MTHRTSESGHENNFDLIRLFGAMQVALLHTVHHLALDASIPTAVSWLVNQFPGVPIFFVVSGYLVSASLERSPSLERYARNRALRIFPALWTCFGVTLLLLGVLGALTPAFLRSTFVPWVVAQLTVAQFFNPDALRGVGVGVINGSLWTIPVELGFYVALPVLWLGRRHRAFQPMLVAVALASYALWLVTQSPVTLPVKLLSVSPMPHLWMFLCGVLARLHRDRVVRAVSGRFLAWLALYLLVARALAYAPAAFGGLAYLPLAATVLAAAYSRPRLATSLLRGNDVSYGLYIYHMLVVNLAVTLGLRGSTWAVPAVLLVSTLLGLASWRLVERPALRRKTSMEPGELRRQW